MLRDTWTKTLWDQRRMLLGWAIGFALVSLIYGGFYPFAATPEYEELIDSLPPGIADAFGWDDIASPAGYLGSTVYGILGPVLAIVMAIGLGSRAIAGSEEDGSLELLVTHPVSRTSVVLQKAAALGIAMVGAGIVVFLVIMAIRDPIDLDLSWGNIAAASVNLALMGMFFGSVAVLAGAITGRKGTTVGITAGAAVFAFLANGIAPQVDALAWMQNLSPFYWANGTATLRDGFDPLLTLLLVGSSAVALAASVVTFNRRDIGV
ncbi:MAG: ABC transporter permease subunit [Acidimicrobiia bacterium]